MNQRPPRAAAHVRAPVRGGRQEFLAALVAQLRGHRRSLRRRRAAADSAAAAERRRLAEAEAALASERERVAGAEAELRAEIERLVTQVRRGVCDPVVARDRALSAARSDGASAVSLRLLLVARFESREGGCLAVRHRHRRTQRGSVGAATRRRRRPRLRSRRRRCVSRRASGGARRDRAGGRC